MGSYYLAWKLNGRKAGEKIVSNDPNFTVLNRTVTAARDLGAHIAITLQTDPAKFPAAAPTQDVPDTSGDAE